MLSHATMVALSQCTINNGVLTLGAGYSDKEFLELKTKLRAALLNHKIPFAKPIAALFDGTTTLPSVVTVHNNCSKTYLGMLPEFAHCIIMPPENLSIKSEIWNKQRRGSDVIGMPEDKLVGAKSIAKADLIYVQSEDEGDVTLDKCIYCQDTEVTLNKVYVKPLVKDRPPIVTIHDEDGSAINLQMAFGIWTNKLDFSSILKTIGNIAKNYVQIAQTYGLEKYVVQSPMDYGTGNIKFTYKCDIDESVLEEIIRRFAKRLLGHFDESVQTRGTPAYTFCRCPVEQITSMWEDL